MKIVHIIKYFQPKLGYQETFLAKEHMKMGHEVYVITSDRYYPFPHYDSTAQNILGDRIIGVGRFIEEGFKIIRLKLSFENAIYYYLKGLTNEIREIRPDIVINHGIIAPVIPLQLSFLKIIFQFKLVIDSHYVRLPNVSRSYLSRSYLLKKSIKSIIKLIFRPIFGLIINKMADKVVGVSEDTCDFLREYLHIRDAKLDFIPLGAAPELFKFDREMRKQIRRRYRIKENDIVLIYTGKIIKKKGVHLLIKACTLLKSKYNNLKLLIVGNADYRYLDYLRKLIAYHGIEKQVIFVQMVENKNLSKFFSASDISVVPLELSVGMLEAASNGLPIIIPQIHGLEHRIKNRNGFSVEPGNVNDLSKKIELLVSNKQLRIEMGKRSRELIEKELSWSVIAKKFLEF